ncbi:hypothetical protein B0H15DRAFT_958483 [Mycena belliarum]|uniref:Uncharacterized protein n=1 Tax=Mycena belliarum TaxID=1033014 RepID=A0AAD6TQ38_9AGAR|nr:hypothetical protein B0H15DRAFT_958483 [Mycena belliae]
MYTKSQALLSGIEGRIKAAVSSYRRARVALLSLCGPGDWEQVYQVLHQNDIRGMNERTLNEEEQEEERRARALAGMPPAEHDLDEFGDPVEQNRRRILSWIWYTVAAGDTGADGLLHDDIRVEWTKARARADRWREELMFLEEEMRRVLMYCNWKAVWWSERKRARSGVSPELAEGLYAYAAEQEARERRWKEAWGRRWAPVRERARTALGNDLVDVEEALVVELDEEVQYGEEGEHDDLD